ncbi:MAG TPA: hypothetical protein PKI20_05910 [Verrucomicrobiota bacterium]|mgnify:CR=1 FL=1|jgi:hypothetical protein|nr:hypothetical protein [Verrucomicrobiota bacterium]HQL77169.1 hypothetical protein [Verrucomicrobiota bacterium]
MLILKDLQATAAEEDFVEPGEHHHQVGLSLGDGSFRYIRLGPAGITIGNSRTQLAIPRDALLALAEPHLKNEGRSKKAEGRNQTPEP